MLASHVSSLFLVTFSLYVESVLCYNWFGENNKKSATHVFLSATAFCVAFSYCTY